MTTTMPAAVDSPLPLSLPALKFRASDLAPAISESTVKYHHGKHHRAYIDKVNELLLQTSASLKTLEDVISFSSSSSKHETLHNNALQCWNHQFQWLSLAATGSEKLKEPMKSLISAGFGSLKELAETAAQVGSDHFGSGWLWLVKAGRKLKLETTHDAERPTNQSSCVLVIDLWEHAYYLDHQNLRSAYIKKLILNNWNWTFAASRCST